MKAKEYPVIPDDQVIKRAEQELPGWYLEGRWLRRKFNTDGWPTTLMLVNTIGYLAEAAWHHPDLEVTWGKVWIKLRTHNVGGITEKDFALAKQIEQVTLWRPSQDAPLDGTPNKWVRSGSKE
ncbi:MAG: 4a-hydroxytetrahydrobiopterin dehydratase [Candidatus Methylomirabilis sp.]